MANDQLPPPGGLIQVGPAEFSTGGSVSNTGLALHKLGIEVRLAGRIGDDVFGREICRLYEDVCQGLSTHLQVVSGEPSSYTVVISPPGGDRRFLHCPGANNFFTNQDVADEVFDGAALLHFGYPPVMRAMCQDGGAPLVRLFQRAREAGLLTSLDLCGIDPSGWPGDMDWPQLLKNVLPWTDIFLPSRDELAFITSADDREVLAWGCKVLVIKDGVRGLTIRTDASASSLGEGWGERALQAATYIVEVVGTNGAGDTTITGFLAGLVTGESIETAADLACAAGAHCVAAADATSGLCPLQHLHAFLATHPPRRNMV